MFSENNCAARIRFASFLFCLSFLICASSGLAQAGLDLHGKQIDPVLASKGKIAVLIFARTDCPISNRYAPLLQKLSVEFAAQAKFWLIYPDKTATPEQITSSLQQFHYSIPALRDPDHSLAKAAGASITPEAVVFDPQGKLLYRGRIDNLYVDAGRTRAAATSHELQDAIAASIAGKQPPAAAPAVGCYISDLE